MEPFVLTDLIKVISLAAVVLLACNWIRVPALVGLLLTGVLCGPQAFKLVQDPHMVEVLAEIGVVLLLFTIGLEFSLGQLIRLRRAVLLGGGLQVVGTILLCALLARVSGLPLGTAVFLGFLVSLSSTAIVLKVLQSRTEIDSPHGRLALAILIFQDIVILAMILLTPMLAGQTANLVSEIVIILVKLVAVAVFVYVAARKIMPMLLFQVVRTRSRELFMLTIVLICMAIPFLAGQIGLSVALGAFIAGLIISETDYAYQALAGFMPLRDLFTSIFFVSIGMLLDVTVLWSHPLMILGGVALLILLKGLVAAGVVLILGYPLRTAALVGVSLAQIGEFSFILAGTGHGVFQLLDANLFQAFIAATILSMTLTPLLIALGPRIADWIVARPTASRLQTRGSAPSDAGPAALHDHVVIIGYGHSGRNVARFLGLSSIPYHVIEMNAETVRREKFAGQPMTYGDASHEAILERAGIHHARTLVISIPDPAGARKITKSARELNPTIHVIARTRFAAEVVPLRVLGAGDIVADEYEASLELTARVLRRHLVPKQVIEQYIEEERADGYQFLRNPAERTLSLTLDDLRLNRDQADIHTLRVGLEAAVAGRTIAELELRGQYGLTLLAIRRAGRVIVNPGSAETLLPADDLVLFGAREGLERLRELL
jgi:CPA2 family monovalent cation:H+ antiporter-2